MKEFKSLEEKQGEMRARLKAEKALAGRKGRLVVICPFCEASIQIFSGRLQQHFIFAKACKGSGRIW